MHRSPFIERFIWNVSTDSCFARLVNAVALVCVILVISAQTDINNVSLVYGYKSLMLTCIVLAFWASALVAIALFGDNWNYEDGDHSDNDGEEGFDDPYDGTYPDGTWHGR